MGYNWLLNENLHWMIFIKYGKLGSQNIYMKTFIYLLLSELEEQIVNWFKAMISLCTRVSKIYKSIPSTKQLTPPIPTSVAK